MDCSDTCVNSCKFALKAIKFCALDYLVKPINKSELEVAANKAIGLLSEKQTNLRLIEFFRNNNTENKRIAIPSNEMVNFVAIKSIIRCEGENNYTRIFTDGGKKILVSKTLKEYENLLTDYTIIL